MKRSYVIWMSVLVGSAFGCKERFCVEGLNGAGSDTAQYAKYDCSNFGGGTGVHHYHLGGSSNTGGSINTSAGTSSTGGAATGGEATGGSATGGAATGGDVSTGGMPSTGGSPATGGMPATGGTTSVVSWCADADAANCLAINQSGGPDAQNISCASPSVPYGNYTVQNNCPCSVALGEIFIRTDSASSLKSGSLIFSGANSFSIDFNVALPLAQNWVPLSPSRELAPGSYTVQLTGAICRTDSPAPAEGTGVRMTWDGIKIVLSTGLSDQILLGSYYAVTNMVVSSP